MGPRVILGTIVAALVPATLGIGGVLAQTATERDKDRLQQAAIERLQETSSRAVTVELSRSGAVRFADFRVVSAPAPDGDNLPRAAAFLNAYRGLLRLDDAASQLRFIRRSPDGFHIFFRQAHHGIPVFAAELGVHLDDANVTGLVGNYVPDVGVSSSPTLAREEAIGTSLASGAPGARQVGEPELGTSTSACWAWRRIGLVSRGACPSRTRTGSGQRSPTPTVFPTVDPRIPDWRTA